MAADDGAAAPAAPAGPAAAPSSTDGAGQLPLVAVEGLEMRFGERLIQRDVSFAVEAGRIFAIMGGSGCGKSTLLKHMIGLLPPAAGRVRHEGTDYWASNAKVRVELRSRFGMLFQSAALWSSMTVLENVMLPLEIAGKLDAASEREKRAREVLDWVELSKFAGFFPADLSGGMKKRAGLARAIAAEPKLLFLDEPSAGLDPISSRRLDELIVDIRERTGAAVVFVSHELPSLFAIADDGIYLDADSKAPIARGRPGDLLDAPDTHPTVRAFLRREVPAEDGDGKAAADASERMRADAARASSLPSAPAPAVPTPSTIADRKDRPAP